MYIFLASPSLTRFFATLFSYFDSHVASPSLTDHCVYSNMHSLTYALFTFGALLLPIAAIPAPALQGDLSDYNPTCENGSTCIDGRGSDGVDSLLNPTSNPTSSDGDTALSGFDELTQNVGYLHPFEQPPDLSH